MQPVIKYSYYLSTIFLLLLTISCATPFISRINLNEKYNWEKKEFTISGIAPSLISSGEMSVEKKRQQINGTFTIYKAPGNWRLEVSGPFNLVMYTIIINKEGTWIFDDDKWQCVPWSNISHDLFGAYIPIKIVSLMVEGSFHFKGSCAAFDEHLQICRELGIHYLFEDKKIQEIKNSSLTIIRNEKEWLGKGPHSKFSIEINKKSPASLDIKKLFTPAILKDEFDEL